MVPARILDCQAQHLSNIQWIFPAVIEKDETVTPSDRANADNNAKVAFCELVHGGNHGRIIMLGIFAHQACRI